MGIEWDKSVPESASIDIYLFYNSTENWPVFARNVQHAFDSIGVTYTCLRFTGVPPAHMAVCVVSKE